MAFLKTERPRQFTYVPIYYDKQKEELEAQIKRVKREISKEEDGEYRPNFKGQFKKRHESIWGAPAKKGKSMGRWIMLIIYAGLVVAIIYLILNILSAL
jgi:hypothetical protein